MKKLFFIILFFPVLLYAQTDAKVLGIPVTYSYQQFISELAQKTKPLSESYSGETWEEQYFEGTFAGIDSCTFRVLSNNTTGEVEMVNIRKDKVGRSPYYYLSFLGGNDIITLKSLYDQKYGAPAYEKKVKYGSEEAEMYVYKAGTTMIEFHIISKVEDKYDDDILATPIAFDVFYFPHKYKNLTEDNI